MGLANFIALFMIFEGNKKMSVTLSSKTCFLLLLVSLSALHTAHAIRRGPNSKSEQHINSFENSIQLFREDIQRVNNLPETNLTIPCVKISRDITYTKKWTFADWEEHQAVSILRYKGHICTWLISTTAQNILPTITAVALWTAMVSKLAHSFPKFYFGTTKMQAALAFIQAPILLLLALRTNRALDRLLETRRAWGLLCRSTRTCMGLISAYITPSRPDEGLIMARYLAFCGWSLKATLRKHDDDVDMINALFHSIPAEKDWLLNCPVKRPTALVARLRSLLSNLAKDVSKGGISIPPVALLRIEETLYDMEQVAGICNRMMMTPIPPTYTRHTSRVLVMYMFLLPIGLIGMDIPLLPAIITAISGSYIMVGIDEIGLEVENPFNLLPMQAMSQTIQSEVESQVSMMSSMPSITMP